MVVMKLSRAGSSRCHLYIHGGGGGGCGGKDSESVVLVIAIVHDHRAVAVLHEPVGVEGGDLLGKVSYEEAPAGLHPDIGREMENV
jgi:hypothetical protein